MEAVKDSPKTFWAIDQSHSEITFRVRHLMIAHVSGSFKGFEASISATGKDFTKADIDLWIDVSTIHTGDHERDAHLMSSDFFDAAIHKQITFVSSSVSQTPDNAGNRELWGELTMKGITKNVRLWANFGGLTVDPWGNEKAGFTISGVINREDWGLTWNKALESGGIMVSPDVNILCEVELTNVTGKNLKIKLDEGQSANDQA
jgi:polyisoprenoid-binding protein YceI